MQFTTVALAALSFSSALAQGVNVHAVKVGSANGTDLKFFPNNIKAAVGDMVQFQFFPKNHTVTQSTFDNPCSPVALHSNITGVNSGYLPVAADATDAPVYTIQVNDTKPIWLYCAQAKHCQSGMVMVINENTAANASRSLAAFTALAATQAQSIPAGGGVSNGTTSTTTGTGDGSASSTNLPSSASSFKISESLAVGGVLAVVMALFV